MHNLNNLNSLIRAELNYLNYLYYFQKARKILNTKKKNEDIVRYCQRKLLETLTECNEIIKIIKLQQLSENTHVDSSIDLYSGLQCVTLLE